MKHFYIIATFFTLISCKSFDERVMEDPKYNSGKEFETGKKIQPRVFHYGDYTFILGYSDKGASLGGYYLDKEFIYKTGGDGFFDTVYKANFNNDDNPDFLVSYPMEDYSVLTALYSTGKNSFKEIELGDPFVDIYCLVGKDTIEKIEFITLMDIDKNKKDEVLINTAVINGKRIGIACSDTLFVKEN